MAGAGVSPYSPLQVVVAPHPRVDVGISEKGGGTQTV